MKISSYSLLLKIKIFLFSSALFGFGLVAMLVTNPTASRLITVPYRALILLLSIIIIFFGIQTNIIKNDKKNPIKKISLIFIVFLFIIIYSFRLLYDTAYNDTLSKDINEYILLWFGICLLPAIGFLFLDLKQSNKYLSFSFYFLCIASILLLPLILQGQTSRILNVHGRLGNEVLNPISIGHQSVSFALICMNLLFNKNNSQRKKLNKIYVYFFLILSIYLVMFAGSRGPIVAMSICSFLFLIKLKIQGINIFKIISLIVIFSFLINFVISFASDSGSSLIERFTSTLNGDEFYDSRFILRPELYQRAIKLFLENSLLGYGIELPYIGYPHNLILEAFLSTGLFGGCLFLIIYVYTVMKSINLIMDRYSSWSWLGLLYIQYAIGVMFSGSIYGSYTFWYLLFAIVGLDIKTKLPSKINYGK